LNVRIPNGSLVRPHQSRIALTLECDDKEPKKMADTSRAAQLTAELLRLSQQQTKALEDATFLGWQPGQLEAYQERGERVSLLRQRLNVAALEETLEVLPGTLPATPDFDAEPS
jgi:hypothetical protein